MDKYKARTMASKSVVAVLTASMTLGSFPIAAFAEPSDEIKAQAAALTQMAYANDGASDQAQAEDGSQATAQLTADQAAQLLADSGSADLLPDPTAMPEIADGTYTVNVEMREAANPSNLSMAANTVSREAKLVAKDGQVTLTIDFKAWNNSTFGDVYLGGLYYYNKAGVKTPGKVVDTQKNADGTPVKDKFSDILSTIGVSEYPDHVEIPLSDTTVVNNYFKLGVFVPVMESLFAGQGSKDALLNVDWSSLKSDAPAEADTTALKAVIEEAQKVEKGNKTDDAFQALQAAIAAAQKVVDSKPTDQNAVDEAVNTLKKAVEDFNASEEAKPEAGLEEGKAYSVPVAFKKADGSGEDSMSGGFFQPKATVTREGGAYTVTLTTKLTADQRGWMSDFEVGGKVAETKQVDENNVSFTFATDDISQAIEASVKVAPMGSSPSLLVVLDASKAEEVKPAEADKTALNEAIAEAQKVEKGNKTDKAYQALKAAIASAQKVAGDEAATQDAVNSAAETLKKAVEDFNNSEDVKPSTDPYEAGYKLYYKAADATAQFGRSFESKVKVVPQTDGTYVVELTAKTLGTSGQLGDVTLAGEAVKYTDHEDGSRTYELPVKDVKGTVNFTFGYTAGKYNANHPFQLVLDGGEYAGIAGFVDEQISVAEAALKAGENKTDEAKTALQKVIDAAKAATDDATRSTALNSLVTAINTFKASADKPQGALQDGALYEVPVSIVNDEIEKPGIVELSMEKLFSKGQKALVTYKDGKYTVQITTLYTGSNGVSDVEYGADNAVATKASATADTITWNLTVDTLDDLHIVGNWVSSGSGEKYARAKGTIGFDASSAVKVSATDEQKSALTDAIAEAKKVEQGKKSVTAFQKLADAIASAEKVAANSFATADQTTGATDSVKKAVEDFNASADVTTNPQLKDGSYNVSLNIAVPHPNAVSSSYDHPEWDGAREFISKAISTKAKVVVKDGKYTLSLNLDTVASYDPTAGSMWPAIGKVQYYTGYDIADGVATGTLADATINSYITWSGSDEHVSNKYGTDYPANISIPLDSEALTRDDATLPLEVSIPHFKTNGYGTGTEQVMAQIDWSTAINTDELGSLIDSAKKVEQGTKTLSAFEDLQDAITAAEKVLNGGSKVQSDYDNATAALQKAVDTFNNSAEASKLDKDTLAPGTYEVQLEMFGYTAPDVHSMSDGSVEHTAQVAVDDEGNYSLVITTKGQYMAQYGGTFYMGAFNMYDDDGTTVIPGTVLDTVKNEDGSEYTDQFNTGSNPVQKGAYPAKVSLPLSKKAVDAEAGRVKVQVFVPVMESLMGKGHQDAYARIDWTTLAAKDVKPTEVDTTALKAAIAEAQKVGQGNKTDEAFKTLKDAIAEAQKVASAAKDQDTVDAAVVTLNKAVETFKSSPNKPADLEAGKVYTAKAQLFKQDGTTEFRTVLLDLDKVEVRKNADGKYEADISTVPGYINASYNFKLSDGFDGTEPTIVWQSDNDYTFRVTGDSLDSLQAHLTYAGGMMGGNTDEKLVIKLSDAKTETVDKSALADAIKNAPEQGNKTDEAFATLTAAKEAAQKVAGQADATTAEVKTALSTFQAAVEAFNKAENKPAEAYESAYQIYYKGADATDQYVTGDRASFNDKVRVVPQADGTAIVELTAKSLGNAGKLADVKVDGQAVKYTDHEDGSRTYELPVKDVKGTTDFTFGYTVSYGGSEHTNEHPFQLVLAGGTYSGYTATKAFLDEQIASAKKRLSTSKKDDTANEAYQKAIDAAQAVSGKEGATPAEYGKAVQDLDVATKAFNASEDAKPEAGLEEGKSYSVPVAFHKTGTTEDSMSGGFFQDKATVVVNEGGTYTVTLTTKLTADQRGWMSDFKVGGKAADTKQVDENNVSFTFTVDDISKPITASVYVQPMGSAPSLDVALDASKAEEVKPAEVDKTALNDAIASAQKVEQGGKTDEAFKTLQDAIAAAQKVAGDEAATQDAVNSATEALKKAVEDFNASEEAKPEAGLEEGKAYSVPVAFKKADGSGEDSMSGGFFRDKATVTREGGTYTVTLTTKLTADQRGWMSDFKVGGQLAEAKQVDENNVSFTFATDDISQAIEASVKVAPMGSSPSLLVVLDASKAEEVKPEPAEKADTSKLEAAIKQAQSIKQGNKTDKAFKALQDAIDDAQEVVKAGHTKDEQSVVDKATEALNAAIKTFNNSANKPSQPDTPDAGAWKAGHTYEIPLSVWMNNQVDGATVNMTRYYSTTGVLEVAKDGALDFQFTILAPDKFQGLQYGGKDVQPEMVDGKAVYHLKVSESELNNTTGIETRMRIDAMGGWFTMNIRTDTSKAKDVTEAGGNGGGTTPTTPSAGKVEAPATANGSVTVDRQEAAKGETVTLTPRADEGYHVSSVRVTDGDGRAVSYAYRADGTFSFEMPEGQATVRVEFARDAAKAFSDVAAGMWQAAGVDFVSSRGIMNGYQNADGTDSGAFGVGDELSRGQFATLLHNHAQPGLGGAKADNETGLPDVLGGQYYTASVNWAVANGVINGYEAPDGSRTFGADDPVTLEQMVTIVANLKGADATRVDLSVLDRFVDGGEVSQWARPYVAWAVQEGLVNGSVEADGLHVRPTEAITRGRVATVLMNAFQTGILK